MMKKLLEISKEVEQHLAAIIDTALKSVGLKIKSSVDYVVNSIIQKAEDKIDSELPSAPLETPTPAEPTTPPEPSSQDEPKVD